MRVALILLVVALVGIAPHLQGGAVLATMDKHGREPTKTWFRTDAACATFAAELDYLGRTEPRLYFCEDSPRFVWGW